ncbi:MAG: hypothetical protein V4544_02435 [Pseudomonadota bacterium]
MMGGGTCRYVNAVTYEDLITKDCAVNSETLKEINTRLGYAGGTMTCELSGGTCSTAAAVG